MQTYDLHAHDPANPNPATEWQGNSVESAVPFAMDHNVLTVENALNDCAKCHTSPSVWLLDRHVLVDPFGPDADATPIYELSRDTLERDGYVFLGR